MSNVDVFANIRNFAPRELIEFLEQLVFFFPEELKYRLKQVLDALPPQGDNMQKVLELVRSQWRSIQSQEDLHIAVVGPAETGKTSLVREILQKQIEFGAPIFTIVDIQGLDEYLGYGTTRTRGAEELENTDVVLLVLDAAYGLSEATVQLYERLQSFEKPILVVLNKMDLAANPGHAIGQAKDKLGANVFPVSLSRQGQIEKLLKAIVAANPKALYPLAQDFPEFRRTICNAIVTQSAFSASVVGAIPIPVSDLLPITAIQTAMLLKIARAFGHQLNHERARELLPMLGLGALVREGAHRLRDRHPGKGGFIAVTVAGLWTFALGRLATRYFERMARFLEQPEESSFQPPIAAKMA